MKPLSTFLAKTCVIFTALLVSISGFSANDRQIDCYVVSINDGDTFTCLWENNKQLKVRLQEIDAPEKSQAFGHRARQTLAQFVHKQDVRLQISGYDRYQRILATVYVQNQNINLKMVQLGMAWAYDQYVQNPVYLQAQQNAQRQKIGLWQDPNAIPPSEFRHHQRGN
ncbi:MAG: thermonuclease family protein [Lonepinella koalarum]|nr:thermonuclease family protein [Lonepinella koalarum]